MNRKWILAVMTLLLTIGFSSAVAHADTLNFVLSNPTQYMSDPAGGTLTYTVTASAPGSNGAAVNLNGDGFNVDLPLTLDDSDFFVNAPLSLNPGDSATFDIFTITVPPNTPPGAYLGTFTVLGGADGGSSDTLAVIHFTTNVTPEPGSFILLGSGLTGLIGVVRRRRQV